MSALFNEILYRPFLNALVFLYNTVAIEDIGIAIILLTLVIRFALFPIFQKAMVHQRLSQEIQPRIKKIQEKHKNDKEAQAKEIFALYAEYKINPFTPFLLLLVQLPVLIALYQVFRNVASGAEQFGSLYSFVHAPAQLELSFLGAFDLAAPSIALALVAAGAQFIQTKLSLSRVKKAPGNPDTAEMMGKMMLFIGPGMTLAILWHFPAAIGLYWLTTTIFSIIQQVIVNKGRYEGSGEKNK